MLKAVAFLYQFQRERITIHGNQMVVANLQDYERARSLVEPMLKVAITEWSKKTEELIKDASKFRGEDSFTRKQLESILYGKTEDHEARPKWHRNIFGEHMGEAMRLGCIETVGERKQGKAIEYKFVQSLEAQIDPLCSVNEIQQAMEIQQDMEREPDA